jgi:hypothetical protein
METRGSAMPYSTDIAKTLNDQLQKFTTLNRHQLAGQAANLDFWLGEVRHCFNVIDEYRRRFDKMKVAQREYVSHHHTTAFDLDDPCCTQGPPAQPKPIPHSELQHARQSLSDATYRLLLRCLKHGLIVEADLRKACDELNIGVDSTDVRQHSINGE